jgi:pimeloyl-ACP methyl ester carboxylesterase
MQSPGHRRLSQTNTQSVAPTPRTSLTVDGRMNLSGGAMAYTVAGTGPTVLLIHGLGGTRQTWRHLIAPLARNHTVIAPDLPGHGQSDPPAGDYSLGAHACALRDLLLALGHQRATLVGHSWAEALHYKPPTSFLNAPIASC